jgi:hypothetical protein
MEENNINNEAPVETSVVAEPVVEAPMPEANVEPAVVESVVQEPSAWEKYKVSAAEESADKGAITTQDLSRGSGTVQAVGQVANGVIGVTQVERKVEQPSTIVKKSNKTVAIHSTKNVSLPGVGKVYRGYNIVTPEQAERWLTRDHIRLATPEEVAKEFGR